MWASPAAPARLPDAAPAHSAAAPTLQAWSAVPARLANLQRHKGRLAPSYDADIVVWNPDAVADTSEAALQHRHKVTPYRDLPIKGRVLATFVRGSQVFAEAQGVAPQACGRAIRAPRRWW